MARNVRTDIASSPVTTLADGDFVFALPAVSGNLVAIRISDLKTVLGCPAFGIGDPNGSIDGPKGRTYYDATVGSEREWMKTTDLGDTSGWI